MPNNLFIRQQTSVINAIRTHLAEFGIAPAGRCHSCRRPFYCCTMERAESFFLALQYAARDYIALSATKTGIVYRLLGNAPTATSDLTTGRQ